MHTHKLKNWEPIWQALHYKPWIQIFFYRGKCPGCPYGMVATPLLTQLSVAVRNAASVRQQRYGNSILHAVCQLSRFMLLLCLWQMWDVWTSYPDAAIPALWSMTLTHDHLKYWPVHFYVCINTRQDSPQHEWARQELQVKWQSSKCLEHFFYSEAICSFLSL